MCGALSENQALGLPGRNERSDRAGLLLIPPYSSGVVSRVPKYNSGQTGWVRVSPRLVNLWMAGCLWLRTP